MNLLQLLEASDEAKKYVDKDGKTVYRLPRKEQPPNEDDLTAPRMKATRRPRPGESNLSPEALELRRSMATPSKDDLYGHTGYDPRVKRLKKGERVDPDFIGSLLRFAHERKGKLYYMGRDGERDPTPMADVVEVGYTYKQNPMWGTWHKAQTLELRFHNGTIVPATRLGPSHVIVQDYRFKAYMPSGVAKFWSIIRDHNNR
jgi:hypothetical protein